MSFARATSWKEHQRFWRPDRRGEREQQLRLKDKSKEYKHDNPFAEDMKKAPEQEHTRLRHRVYQLAAREERVDPSGGGGEHGLPKILANFVD